MLYCVYYNRLWIYNTHCTLAGWLCALLSLYSKKKKKQQLCKSKKSQARQAQKTKEEVPLLCRKFKARPIIIQKTNRKEAKKKKKAEKSFLSCYGLTCVCVLSFPKTKKVAAAGSYRVLYDDLCVV